MMAAPGPRPATVMHGFLAVLKVAQGMYLASLPNLTLIFAISGDWHPRGLSRIGRPWVLPVAHRRRRHRRRAIHAWGNRAEKGDSHPVRKRLVRKRSVLFRAGSQSPCYWTVRYQSVRRSRDAYTLRGEKCDVLGREGEPPCEPAGIGEGSDGASPSQHGSIPTTRGITVVLRTEALCGRTPRGPPFVRGGQLRPLTRCLLPPLRRLLKKSRPKGMESWG